MLIRPESNELREVVKTLLKDKVKVEYISEGEEVEDAFNLKTKFHINIVEGKIAY